MLDTKGSLPHVYADLKVSAVPMERPLQKHPHSDFVAREAAKEAAGLKDPAEKPGKLTQIRFMWFSWTGGEIV